MGEPHRRACGVASFAMDFVVADIGLVEKLLLSLVTSSSYAGNMMKARPHPSGRIGGPVEVGWAGLRPVAAEPGP
jgi:hypothetical protein